LQNEGTIAVSEKGSPSTTEVLNKSAEAIRRGDVHAGRQGLIWVVQRDPTNIPAWLWLGYITEDRKAKLDCYQRVLHLDPANDTARKAIAKYGGVPTALPEGSPMVPPTPRQTPLSELEILEMQPAAPSTINSRLDQSRRDLLDLSLYNRLLNYRPLKSKGLEIIDEKPVEVFRILVQEGRSMSFLRATRATGPSGRQPLLVEEQDSGERSLEQPEDEDESPLNRHTDTKLQTPYESEILQTRLLSTYYAARTYVEEQGVNVLFLALGMLHWYEAPSSQEARRAPLILIPVELSRTNARSKFRVRFNEEEIGENLSLRAKLESDFALKLPNFPDAEDLDVAAYLQQVAGVVRAMPRWKVDDEAISLGFFSFGKFLMFHDLEAELWPTDNKPADHAVLSGLLGNGFAHDHDSLGDDIDTDEALPPEDIHHVLDADSSQTVAILEAARGRDLVIQGPPGTGKSQTIANVIAEAIASHKTVLFVAEKMAALEVVKRRLDQVGLGEACLELHSHKTNKKSLLAELRRAMDLGQPKVGKSVDLADLKRSRDKLNDYCRAVNEEIGDSGLTTYDIYGRLLLLRETLVGTDPPDVDIPDVENWPQGKLRAALSLAEELQVLLEAIGRPIDHPFWGCRVSSLLPSDEAHVSACLRAAVSGLRTLGKEAVDTAKSLTLQPPTTPGDVRRIISVLKYLQSAPSLSDVKVDSDAWIVDTDHLKQVAESGLRLADLRRQYQPIVRLEAWNEDVASLRATLQSYASKWWRGLAPEYRSASRQVRRLCQKTYPRSLASHAAVLNAILTAQSLAPIVDAFASKGAELFGRRWEGERSDWKWLRDTCVWMATLHAAIQRRDLPATILSVLPSLPELSSLRDRSARLEHLVAESSRFTAEVVAALHLDESVLLGEGQQLDGCQFAVQAHLLTLWSSELSRLREMATLSGLLARAEEAGLNRLATASLSWAGAARHLVAYLEHIWLIALLQRSLLERPVLAQFNSNMHGHALRKFCELDLGLLRQNRILLAHQHWRTLPRYMAGGQLGVLRLEFEKKRRQMPIRRLMAETGRVIQVLKPVFMMSPLSVAMYLPPGSVSFDLVVFDEASQVKPVDAFGAILRGHHLVVVGDDRQLPPTTFFETGIDVDDDYSDSVTVDLESILGLCVAKGVPQRMLRWHYRSHHESLIAVSNYEFYDNKLTVFPSPERNRQTVGLVFHCLPDTEYGRGGTRKNIAEAKAVAEAVLGHARKAPELTLGVAAFSVSQMEAIRDQLEILRRSDPSCEEFFHSHPEEPFFVKNLENVQGDERDVIFISIGYGRTAEKTLSMNFGPLNADGGERRLNVLITRARKRCEVFANFRSDDLDLHRTSARGVAVLKRFLKYAETGSLDLPMPSEREPGSAFEEAVASRLRLLGHRVETQVGTGGFFIDLAIVDSTSPGRYLIGIECDGASYHSARSARDRDRLRQEVLRALGWRIHRIWSTDWFRNPDSELARVQDAILAAQSQQKVNPGMNDSPQREPQTEVIPRAAPVRAAKCPVHVEDYFVADIKIHGYRDSLHEAPPDYMAEWIRQVVSIESPVHQEEVLRRIAEAAGVKRVGNRIEASFHRGLQAATRSGLVRKRGVFIWDPRSGQPHIRSREPLPVSSRQLEMIAPEEIALAALSLTKSSYGIGRQELSRGVCELFGFARVTEGMISVVDKVISRMLADGRLVAQGDLLEVPLG
jgi:very-short-patch-repair endonuclease